MEDKSNNFFSAVWLLDLYRANKGIIHIVLLCSLVVFSILAYILPSEYRATVVLFPASNESVSRSLLSDNEASKGISKFGENEEVEYFLQVLYSDEIRERLTRKFNLYEHYRIDTGASFPKTRLARKWDSNISFRKTEFLSVEIEVFDKEPSFAAKIANAIADYSDTIINKMKHERAQKAFMVVQKEYFDATANIQQLQDSLNKLRALGVIDYETQSEVYSDAYAQALAKGNKEGAKALEEKLKILAQYGGAYQTFDNMLTNESKRVSSLKEKYIEAKVDAEQSIPYKFIVSKAEAPEREYYPIRWLIVVGGVLSVLVFTIFLLAFLSQKKKHKTEE
jgi:capsule polysaccharide export protein KpsE/RkpR